MQQSSVLGQFNLAEEMQTFDPSDRTSRRRAETLIKTDRLRVVLVTMLEGGELQEHTAPGPITIHALTGAFTVHVDDGDIDIPAGNLISIEAGARHAVRATQDGAFLLTIGWTPESSQE